MSAGPSPLGTLLVQRLDAALGTTLSAQANIVSGAHPDAVTQPGHPERPDAPRNELIRHPRDVIDRAAAQAEQHGRSAVDRARLDARTAAALLARNAPNTSATPSAPTTLGQAAKTILALLANYPEQSAAVMGKRPLFDHSPNTPSNPRAFAGQQALPNQTQPTTGHATAGSAVAGDLGSAARGGGASAGTNAGTSVAGQGAGTASGVMGSALPSTGASMALQLSQALTQALQGSGMFYESHLNQLAFGQRSEAALRQEPQAQAGRQAPNPASSSMEPATSGTAARPGEASSPSTPPSPPPLPAATASAITATPSAALAGLDPQTHMLVRQQLEVLANQTFAWRGEAWPDAPLEWEVSRRPASQEADATDQTDHWATRIRVHLPLLGEVQARLTLSGQQLVMHVVAPDSAGLLDAHAEALRGRYSAQGLQLSQLSITTAPAQAGDALPAPVTPPSAGQTSQNPDETDTP